MLSLFDLYAGRVADLSNGMTPPRSASVGGGDRGGAALGGGASPGIGGGSGLSAALSEMLTKAALEWAIDGSGSDAASSIGDWLSETFGGEVLSVKPTVTSGPIGPTQGDTGFLNLDTAATPSEAPTLASENIPETASFEEGGVSGGVQASILAGFIQGWQDSAAYDAPETAITGELPTQSLDPAVLNASGLNPRTQAIFNSVGEPTLLDFASVAASGVSNPMNSGAGAVGRSAGAAVEASPEVFSRAISGAPDVVSAAARNPGSFPRASEQLVSDFREPLRPAFEAPLRFYADSPHARVTDKLTGGLGSRAFAAGMEDSGLGPTGLGLTRPGVRSNPYDLLEGSTTPQDQSNRFVARAGADKIYGPAVSSLDSVFGEELISGIGGGMFKTTTPGSTPGTTNPYATSGGGLLAGSSPTQLQGTEQGSGLAGSLRTLLGLGLFSGSA